MELLLKIKLIIFKYNKLLSTDTCTYLSKVLLILEVQSLLTSPKYEDEITSDQLNTLNTILEDL